MLVPLRPTDASALIALELATFGAALRQPARVWLRALRAPTTLAFGLHRADCLAAAVVARRRQGSRWIHVCLLVVEPGARRQGWGRRLLALVQAAAPGHGLRLEARADAAEVHAFYHRLGFRAGEELPDFYADGAAARRFRLAGTS